MIQCAPILIPQLCVNSLSLLDGALHAVDQGVYILLGEVERGLDLDYVPVRSIAGGDDAVVLEVVHDEFGKVRVGNSLARAQSRLLDELDSLEQSETPVRSEATSRGGLAYHIESIKQLTALAAFTCRFAPRPPPHLMSPTMELLDFNTVILSVR